MCHPAGEVGAAPSARARGAAGGVRAAGIEFFPPAAAAVEAAPAPPPPPPPLHLPPAAAGDASAAISLAEATTSLDGIESVDLTHIVEGHVDYRARLEDVLHFLRFEE